MENEIRCRFGLWKDARESTFVCYRGWPELIIEPYILLGLGLGEEPAWMALPWVAS